MKKDEFTKGVGNVSYNIGKAVALAKNKAKPGGDTGAPKIYLDMDGVLADFFTEYAKLAGIKNGNYRDIPPAKTDPTLNKMVGTDFFNNLPLCRNAEEVVKAALKFAKAHGASGYCICSSPLRGDHKNSEYWKREWIKTHLNPQPVEIIIAADKSKYARQANGTPNILIDDRGSNISSWEAAGGVGIKYQADEDSIGTIDAGLARADKIIAGKEKLKPQQLVSKVRNPADQPQQEKPSSAADVAENVGGATTGTGAVGSSGGPAVTVGGKGKGKRAKVIRRASIVV